MNENSNWLNEDNAPTTNTFSALRLSEGSHILEVLEEPKEVEVTFQGKMRKKLVFPVKYNEQVYNWYVPIASKRPFVKRDGGVIVSRYYQLFEIGKKRGGLAGAVLKVTLEGKLFDTRYTIELK